MGMSGRGVRAERGGRRGRAPGRRRAVMAVGALVGVLATAPAPGPAGAVPGQTPEITVTEITHPDGTYIGLDYESEITERGRVLVTTDPYRRSWAVWERGSLTPLEAPSDARVRIITDMSERGQVVGTDHACEPDVPQPRCTVPYVWTDGHPTAVPTDGLNAGASGINDRGDVLVSRSPAVDPGQPYPEGFERTAVWRKGRLLTPPPTSDTWNGPVDINDRGQVAVMISGQGGHAGVWQAGGRGGVVDLGTLPGYSAFVVGINERGHIVGEAHDPETSLPGHAALWRDGDVVDLGTLGGDWSTAEAVNDRDEVVGLSETADGVSHPYLWRRGRMIDLGTLGDDQVTVTALNNRGQVIGHGDTGVPGLFHAFLWHEGQMIDLGALVDPDEVSVAYDINDRGQIIGRVGTRPVIWTIRSRPTDGPSSGG